MRERGKEDKFTGRHVLMCKSEGISWEISLSIALGLVGYAAFHPPGMSALSSKKIGDQRRRGDQNYDIRRWNSAMLKTWSSGP